MYVQAFCWDWLDLICRRRTPSWPQSRESPGVLIIVTGQPATRLTGQAGHQARSTGQHRKRPFDPVADRNWWREWNGNSRSRNGAAMPDRKTIDEFLAQRHVAVVGVSRTRQFANGVYMTVAL